MAHGLILVANPQPDLTPIHNAFRQLPLNPNDIAPYFDGYLGSHVSIWPEFRQLHGLFGTPSVNPQQYIRLVHRRTRKFISIHIIQILH